MKRLKEKGKLSPAARLEEVIVPETRFENLEVKISFRPELLRTVLKMTMSLASLLPDFEHSEVYEGRLYLMHDPKSDTVNCVRIDGVNCAVLDAERKPLNHLVYVERSKGRIQGAVQLFGGVQLFCDLGRYNETKAGRRRTGESRPNNWRRKFYRTSRD
ncbi:MAG: hypothetical protein IPM25_07860 [Chloracidobacterium sp.]|nr:hypothetical protein [Chloracidobacterium sp.]